MYIEMKKTGLDVSDLITLVQRKGGGNTGFPYKSFVCRCSNCLYTRYEIRQETDSNGNVVEVTEEIITVYLTVITTPKIAVQIAEEYGFTVKQKDILQELLSEENENMWINILRNNL